MVPSLMCANVWPKFKLFQKFQQENILLVRTTCEEFEPLKCRLKYEGYLTHKSTKKFKTYIQYIYDLKIYKDNRQCIFIRQTFIKKEVNDEV